MAEDRDDDDWDVIFAYSRAQAIEDGLLVDVSDLAREAGFVLSVAVTRTVWAECVEVHDGGADQDEQGRLWDVLFMLRIAIKMLGPNESRLKFTVMVRNRTARLVELEAVCGPGDDARPVITIMFPGED